MIIYIELIFIIILLSLFCKFKMFRKTYCILCTILLIVIVGCRSPYLGRYDTELLYLPMYQLFPTLRLSSFVQFILNRDTEFLFYFCTFLFSKVIQNDCLYLILLAIPIYSTLGYFIYKYSKYPSISFLLFICLNYFGNTFYMLRHMIAMCFIPFAFDNLLKGNKKKFIIYILIGALFHRTVLIFLIYLLIYNRKKKPIFSYSFYSFIIFSFVLIFGNKLLNFFFFLLARGHFSFYIENHDAGTLALFIANFIILLYLEIVNKNEKNIILENFVKVQFLATILSTFTLYFDGFIRIASFFSCISIISIPYSTSLIKEKNIRIFINLIMTILLITYFCRFSVYNNNLIPYEFYWEVIK